MKADIHPKYNEVVFHDISCDFKFLTRSTMTSKEKVKWEDGKEYLLQETQLIVKVSFIIIWFHSSVELPNKMFKIPQIKLF